MGDYLFWSLFWSLVGLLVGIILGRAWCSAQSWKDDHPR